MATDFVLLKAECPNANADDPCRIVLLSVKGGCIVSTDEFLINPTHFDWAFSGLTKEEVSDKPDFPASWKAICSIIKESPIIVSASEGYDAHVLYNALQKFGISYSPMKYVNAKALLRKLCNSVSYSIFWLAAEYLNQDVDDTDQCLMARQWTELVCMMMAKVDHVSIESFCNDNNIKVGVITENGLTPSLTKKDYSKRKAINPAEGVNVTPIEDNPFYGASVVFTGKLENFQRIDAQREVVKIGGECPPRLTMDTDFLVVGNQDLRIVGQSGLSGKMKNAQKFREKGSIIEIINETEFIEMLQIGK